MYEYIEMFGQNACLSVGLYALYLMLSAVLHDIKRLLRDFEGWLILGTSKISMKMQNKLFQGT